MKEFKMTEEQAKKFLADAKPSPLVNPATGLPIEMPHEAMNKAWQNLAKELNFIWHTARPIPGKDKSHFFAQVQETH